MVCSRSVVLRFYHFFIFISSLPVLASSDFGETPPTGYKAPHSSMMPGHIDPHPAQGLNRVAVMKKTARLEDQQSVLQYLEKSNEMSENVAITTTEEVSSPAKKTSPRAAKLKLVKEKDAKGKKLKAQKKKKSQPKEPTASGMTNTNVREDTSRVVTMVFKPDGTDFYADTTVNGQSDYSSDTMIVKEDEVSSRVVTMVIKPDKEDKLSQEFNHLSIVKKVKPSPVSKSLPRVIDELLPSQKKTQQQTFSLPPRLEAWELILLLLAGDDPTTGMTHKVYFPDKKLSCNYKSLLAGKKEKDLIPFLMLDSFKNSQSLAILQKYLVIKDKHQSVKTSFSQVETLTIDNAVNGFKKEIEKRCLNEAGARFNTDEKRSNSTLAGHTSKLAEYQIVEKEYVIQGVMLSLTFYQKEEK